jgi:hypothetical protein
MTVRGAVCRVALAAGLLGCGGDGDSDSTGANQTLDADVSSVNGRDAGSDATIYELSGAVGPVKGTGTECTGTSDAREEGRCYGHLCGTNSNSVKAALAEDSPCATDPEVWLVCDGSGAREATRCARNHALDDDPRAGTRSCIRSNEALSPFSSACVDCFLDAVDCARANCLSECLAGDSPVCDKCQEDQGCTSAFFACSGLPNPK